MSPCTEVSGVVLEVGSECKKIKVGEEVIVAFAGNAARSEIVVEERQVLRKPKHLSHLEASALFVGYATVKTWFLWLFFQLRTRIQAYHGLIQRGHLQKGETVLITGAAGGMGRY